MYAKFRTAAVEKMLSDTRIAEAAAKEYTALTGYKAHAIGDLVHIAHAGNEIRIVVGSYLDDYMHTFVAGGIGPAGSDVPRSSPAYLPEGWTEATPGGMATNRDPIKGGIVDNEIVSGKWFAIFNRSDIAPFDGFATRAEAFAAFHLRLAELTK